MNGQNKETKEGFIKGLGHPRKKELATLLIGGEATIESLAAAGFGRINVMEMAREIRQNVTGMEEFNFEWGRKVDVEVAKPTPAPFVDAPVQNEPQVNTTDAPVQDAPVVDETITAPTQEELDAMVDYTITEETLEQFNASIAEGMDLFKVGDVVKLAPNHPLLGAISDVPPAPQA